MRKILASLAIAGILATPVQARDWRDQAVGVQPGVFVGAKLRLSMGGREAARPVAGLAIAPTQSRIAGDGMFTTRIGEGVALNLTPASKPMLTLAGVRADRALGLTSGPAGPDGTRLGMSDRAKIGIAVVAALAVAAGVFLIVTHCDESESSDDCP